MILNAENGQKRGEIFSCDCCAFTTQRKDNFERHLLTLKHKSAFSKEENGQNGHEKEKQLFHCEKCNYNTLYKTKWNIHLSTLKHKTPPNDRQRTSKFDCKHCSQEYSTLHGLMVHQNKCSAYKSELLLIEQNATLMKTTQELMTKNQTLSDKNQELTDKIIDICTNMKPSSIITNNNNNTTNQAFNLNFFLNETCKNAMTLEDFVSSIQLELMDLEETGRLGFSGGISNIIINSLNKLETVDRPMHNTDVKREIIYIKTDTEWKKDNNKEQLTSAIKQIANKNIQNILPWRELHPECSNSGSRKNDQYLKIVGNAMSGGDHAEIKKNIDKVISNVAKKIVVDK